MAIEHRPRPCSAIASSKVLPFVTLDPPIPHLTCDVVGAKPRGGVFCGVCLVVADAEG